MNAPLIGARVERKEDYRFLTGGGTSCLIVVSNKRNGLATRETSPAAHTGT